MNKATTYFWSGSNRPGEILALAKHGKGIGISLADLDKGGRGLATLLSLAQDTAERIVVNVTQERGGRPILMLGRKRDQLPSGDQVVRVDGEPVVLGFRKIAVNVARAARGGANLLGSLLRGMFGESAGGRGKGHRVVFERTAGGGWDMTRTDLAAAARSQSPVFVDSGAFSEVRFAPEMGRFVDVRPITDADWLERLAAYRRIAQALGSRAFLVAPDKVGDQAETLRRLRRYAPQVRELREFGAQIIVPIQRGELEGAAFDRACAEALGFADYIRGIPSKKAAATPAEIAALSRELPAEARIHLLGMGPASEGYEETIAAIGRPAAQVLCDSVRIRALVGRTNGPGGGPRLLTRLADAARQALGLHPTRRLGSEDAQAVKFHAIDAMFSRGLA